mmetsp:Transcript_972/g.3783  ORF Transcript_972/g.3783 Transcript_972/m.3783 type:complete len:255 (-) Transcript_972:769-1533(-)
MSFGSKSHNASSTKRRMRDARLSSPEAANVRNTPFGSFHSAVSCLILCRSRASREGGAPADAETSAASPTPFFLVSSVTSRLVSSVSASVSFGGAYGGVANASFAASTPPRSATMNFNTENRHGGGPTRGSTFVVANRVTATSKSSGVHGPRGSTTGASRRDATEDSASANLARSFRNTACITDAASVLDATSARACSVLFFAARRSPCTFSKVLVMACRSSRVVARATPANRAATASSSSRRLAAASAASSSA